MRALGYFLVSTIIALALGLLAGNIVKPGNAFEGQVSADARADAKESISEAGGDQGIVAFITDDLLPTSFVAPFVENEILRVLILALLTAAAVSGLAKPQRERIVAAFELAAQVIFRMIRIIMWAAPLGAFGGMAFTVAKFGGRHSRASACLLAKLEAAGASRQAVGVIIPTGYSFNLDGTCIYLTLGALFIVQAAGQEISIGTQIGLLALMVLTSKGAAGITGAGLVTLTASLQAFGGEFFSAESIAVGIALVVGIDRVMSEGRALTNAIGNTVATIVISKWQGELDEEKFHEALREPSRVERATDRALAGAAPA